jgi:hypothetical protein
MNILAATRREERQIEKQLGKLKRRLEGIRAAITAHAGPWWESEKWPV